MNPAEMLRQVADDMRFDHGPKDERHAMWMAMAAWLEDAASHVEDTDQAVAVASAYQKRSS